MSSDNSNDDIFTNFLWSLLPLCFLATANSLADIKVMAEPIFYGILFLFMLSFVPRSCWEDAMRESRSNFVRSQYQSSYPNLGIHRPVYNYNTYKPNDSVLVRGIDNFLQQSINQIRQPEAEVETRRRVRESVLQREAPEPQQPPVQEPRVRQVPTPPQPPRQEESQAMPE